MPPHWRLKDHPGPIRSPELPTSAGKTFILTCGFTLIDFSKWFFFSFMPVCHGSRIVYKKKTLSNSFTWFSFKYSVKPFQHFIWLSKTALKSFSKFFNYILTTRFFFQIRLNSRLIFSEIINTENIISLFEIWMENLGCIWKWNNVEDNLTQLMGYWAGILQVPLPPYSLMCMSALPSSAFMPFPSHPISIGSFWSIVLCSSVILCTMCTVCLRLCFSHKATVDGK